MTNVAVLALFFASLCTVHLQYSQSDPSTQTPKPGIVDLPIIPDGASRVWIDRKHAVYICKGEHDFGKTRKGEYMREAEAKKSGARPKNGVGCLSR